MAWACSCDTHAAHCCGEALETYCYEAREKYCYEALENTYCFEALKNTRGHASAKKGAKELYSRCSACMSTEPCAFVFLFFLFSFVSQNKERMLLKHE